MTLEPTKLSVPDNLEIPTKKPEILSEVPIVDAPKSDTDVSFLDVLRLWFKQSFITSIIRQKENPMASGTTPIQDVLMPVIVKFIVSKLLQIGGGVLITLGLTESSLTLVIASILSMIVGTVVSYFTSKQQLNAQPPNQKV